MRQLREIHVRAIDLEELGVVICNHGYVEDEELRKQYKHNARLIAVAPDLLEALQMLLQQFTKTPSTLKDSEARCKAHAAIRKALGEEE